MLMETEFRARLISEVALSEIFILKSQESANKQTPDPDPHLLIHSMLNQIIQIPSKSNIIMG